jgi:hypothetical protein
VPSATLIPLRRSTAHAQHVGCTDESESRLSSKIPQLEQEIRDLINANRRHTQLCANPAAFSQLCSALDVLGDTELYLGSDSAGGKPALYLRTYGVLQALVLQQDATAHVAESLGIALDDEPGLTTIREVRNNATGHPTRRGRRPGFAFNHVVRWSLSPRAFDLMTFDAKGAMSQQHVELEPLIEMQREIIERRLVNIIESERARENAHRRRFADDHLLDVLDHEIDYWVGKVFEQIEGATGLAMGEPGLDIVADRLSHFERKLQERGEAEPLRDLIEHDLRPARHAIARLTQFFENGEAPELCSDDALAFAQHLDTKVRELRALARELDETYQASV